MDWVWSLSLILLIIGIVAVIVGGIIWGGSARALKQNPGDKFVLNMKKVGIIACSLGIGAVVIASGSFIFQASYPRG